MAGIVELLGHHKGRDLQGVWGSGLRWDFSGCSCSYTDAVSLPITHWTLVDWGSPLSNNAAAWSLFWCFSPTLHFPPEDKALQVSQIPLCKAKFMPSPLFFCVPCRYLHEDINVQEGTSKGLLEIHDRALQKSLGMDAGADARPPGTLRSPSRLIKHTAHLLLTRPHGLVSASVQKHKHWGTHLFSFSRHLWACWAGIFLLFSF